MLRPLLNDFTFRRRQGSNHREMGALYTPFYHSSSRGYDFIPLTTQERALKLTFCLRFRSRRLCRRRISWPTCYGNSYCHNCGYYLRPCLWVYYLPICQQDRWVCPRGFAFSFAFGLRHIFSFDGIPCGDNEFPFCSLERGFSARPCVTLKRTHTTTSWGGMLMMREVLVPVLIGYRATFGTWTVVPLQPRAIKAGQSSQQSLDGPIMVQVCFYPFRAVMPG